MKVTKVVLDGKDAWQLREACMAQANNPILTAILRRRFQCLADEMRAAWLRTTTPIVKRKK